MILQYNEFIQNNLAIYDCFMDKENDGLFIIIATANYTHTLPHDFGLYCKYFGDN